MVQNAIEATNLKNISNANYVLSGWLETNYNSIIAQLLETVDESISINLGLNLLKKSWFEFVENE